MSLIKGVQNRQSELRTADQVAKLFDSSKGLSNTDDSVVSLIKKTLKDCFIIVINQRKLNKLFQHFKYIFHYVFSSYHRCHHNNNSRTLIKHVTIHIFDVCLIFFDNKFIHDTKNDLHYLMHSI